MSLFLTVFLYICFGLSPIMVSMNRSYTSGATSGGCKRAVSEVSEVKDKQAKPKRVRSQRQQGLNRETFEGDVSPQFQEVADLKNLPPEVLRIIIQNNVLRMSSQERYLQAARNYYCCTEPLLRLKFSEVERLKSENNQLKQGIRHLLNYIEDQFDPFDEKVEIDKVTE